ncbi:MAG: hypothetical protein JSV79_02105 [Armatimonadota bacterium]|nr:MAG: hypothetical protein JSV79_02105 [Armatimonadota bacterium]
MRGRLRFACLAVAVLIVLPTAAAVAGGGGGGGGRRGTADAGAGQKVSLDVKDTAIEDALRLLFRDTDQSIVLHPAISRLPYKMTISLKDVPLEFAVRAFCRMYDLEYETDEGLWVVFPREDVVSIAGRGVPIIGAVRAEGAAQRAADRAQRELLSALAAGQSPTYTTRGITVSTSEHPGLPDSIGDILVDLDVKDTTIAEVGAKLSQAAGEAVNITVHDSVPKELKVTAKVYRMPLRDLLSLLADQSNLTYTVGETKEGKAEIHIVPRPELRVSGPGVGLEAVKAWMAAQGARASAAEALRAWEQETGESRRSLGFRLCPQCGDQAMMLHWKFCPHCGTKLPAEEEQAESEE